MTGETPYTVELSWNECGLAAQVGCRRHLLAMRLGWNHNHGGKPDRGEFDTHILGAAGELAVAKYLGTYWTAVTYAGEPVTDRAECDVLGMQVRHTLYDNGCLALHESDRGVGVGVAVLVTGQLPTLTVRGKITVEEGTEPGYWRTERLKHPCFMVPQRDLEPLRRAELDEVAA